MAKAPTQLNSVAIEALELDPDAWPRFERLVKSAAKSGPKPHPAKTDSAVKPATAKKRKPSA
jgi:hypothetical protein